MFESPAGNTERITVGSRINKWSVDSIRDDAVVLKSGTSTKTVEIYQFDAAPVRPTPRRRPRLVRNRAPRSVAPNDPEEIEDSDEEPQDDSRDGP